MNDALLEIMPSHKNIKLGNKSYTLKLEKVTVKEQTKEFDRIHHIHILDRSGSMSSVIGQLMDNVKEVVNTMGDEDLLSIIWFSGEGESKVLLKGARKQEQEGIFKLLDSIKYTIGCTCFSEPLQLAEEVIEDLANLCPNFSINLFTDGEPCVSGSTENEIKKINEITDKLKSKVLALNTIGYTRWADEKLLTSLSQKTAYGRYVFSNDVKDYNEIFGRNYKRIQGLVNIVYKKEGTGSKFYFRNENTLAYQEEKFEQNISSKFELCELSPSNTKETSPEMEDADLENILYQAAYESYYKGNVEFCYDCLNYLKDSYAIEIISNAFSSEERANATKELLAMAYGKGRFKKGKELTENSKTMLCVFDLLNILKDEIFIPSANYKRIGMKVEDTNDIFTLDKNQEYSGTFGDSLVFASDKANVSIRYMMTGKVRLMATAANRVNLPEYVNSKIFRTQTIIKDGELNTDTLEAYVSHNTLEKIRKRCAYYGIEYSKLVQKVYNEIHAQKCRAVFNLRAIPILNRRYIASASDFSQIAKDIKELNEIKARQKILKSFIKDTLFNAKEENYTEEQLQVLKDHGIKLGVYSGIKLERADKEDILSDFYTYRSLDFQQKGWSSLPKIEDVLSKSNIKEGTPAAFMKIAYGEYESIKDDKDLVKQELDKLKERSFELMDELSIIRLYKIKTGGFWEGLKPQSENKYEYIDKDDPNLVITVKTEYRKEFYSTI